ncbi:MAG: hypothetical protein NVS9B7_24930 [Flavisolibacter sp.]
MIKDVKMDTMQINKVIKHSKLRTKGLDSLVFLCFQFEKNKKNILAFHRLYFTYTAEYDAVTFNDRTLSQLKNSGGMRLIKDHAAADSITDYDDHIRTALKQEDGVLQEYRNLVYASEKLIQFRYNQINPDALTRRPLASFSSLSLFKYSENQLMEFGNKVELYKSVVLNYIRMLEGIERSAENLLRTLSSEYHFENE